METSFTGRELGSYRVGRRIGKGGIGAVYEATHVRTGRAYAIKILLEADEESVRRFRREAEALAAIGHAGVVAIHDFHRTPDGLTYMVMDRLLGEDLGHRLERGPMNPQEALARFEEVADALTAAHNAGVLHRDLKPSNIFLLQEGARERAMLLDFGLAKASDGDQTRLTATGQTMGTPLYMSPEQALGEPLDARADVYSMGAVLYEMLCGEPPFDGPTVTAILSKVLTVPPPPFRMRGVDVPSAIESVVLGALSKAREDRPPSMRDFLQALRGKALPPTRAFAAAPSSKVPEAGATAADSVLPPTRATPKATPSTRARKPVALAAAALLLAAGVAVFFFASDRGPGPEFATAPPVEPPEEPTQPELVPTFESPAEVTMAQEESPPEVTPDPALLVGTEPQAISMRPRQPRNNRPRPASMQAPSMAAAATPDVAALIEQGRQRNEAASRQGVALAQSRIAGYRERLRLLGAIGRLSTSRLCGGALPLRSSDQEAVSDVRESLEGSRERLCEIYEETRNPPPDRLSRIERVRSRFARARRDMVERRSDRLSEPDRAEVIQRLDAVARVIDRDPFPCADPSIGRLNSFARELGPQAAQPAIQYGRSINSICVRPLMLPDRERSFHQTVARQEGVNRTNIASQEDVIRSLEQRLAP